MARKRRRVPKDKATGLPKKYLSGAKNRAAKAREIKRTAEAYKRWRVHRHQSRFRIEGQTRWHQKENH